MADFQELGIKLEAVDNASAKLQKVVDLLEKIKKLSGGGTTTTGSGSTSGITRQVTALRSVANIYNKLRVASKDATNAEIAYINAQNRQITAAARYQDAQNKTAAAIENVAAAQERLKSAQFDYNVVHKPQGDLTAEESARYDVLEAQGFNQIKASAKLEAAQKAVASAQNAVTTSAQQERSAYAALISAQNGVASATINLRKEQQQSDINDKKSAQLQRSIANATERSRQITEKLIVSKGKLNSVDATDINAKNRLIIAEQNYAAAKMAVADATRAVKEAEAAVANASTETERSKAQQRLISLQQKLLTLINKQNDAYIGLANAQNAYNSSIASTTKSLIKQTLSISGLVAIVRRLSKALFSAVSASGEFVENLNLFAVTFGDNYQETLNWALDFAKNLGVASSEIVRFTGLFKQLADSIGVANEIGDEMSQTLTQLGYDLASFYNISTESAFEKLQAGIFSGQTKPLRSLGLDVTAQTLDNLLKTNEAFKNLGVTSSKALLQSDKAMLRLIAVLQGAQNSFGDMQRTINTLSNQIKVFQGSLANFKLAIGDLFSEPFRQALVYINAFIIALTDIIRLFKPIKTASETAGAGMEQFADDTEDAVDASTGGGNLDFDEFRVLGDSDSQISITEAITTELQKQIDAYNEQLSAMNSVKNEAVLIAEQIKNWFVITENGEFVAWTEQAQKLYSILSLIATVFAAKKIISAVSGIISVVVKLFSFLNGLNPVVAIIAAIVALIAYGYKTNEQFRESIDNILSVLMTLIQNVLSSLQPILEVIVNKLLPPIIDILDTIFTLLAPIIDLIAWFIDAISPLISAALDALVPGIEMLINLLTPVLSLLKPILDFVLLIVDAINMLVGLITGDFSSSLDSFISHLKQFGTDIIMFFVDLANSVIAFCENCVNSFIKMINGFTAALSKIWTWIPGLEDKAIPKIQEVSFTRVAMADGGITDANFIMTHENGVREWVGKQGNSTAVVNDTQMSTVMSQSVRDGVLEAMSYGTGGNENINITVEAKLDGQKIYESTRRIARKNGEKFAKV